jgi:hypothetical protein
MLASFSPTTTDGLPVKLDTAAQACGFKAFDWQQTIDSWPTYAPLTAADGTNISAPPSFFDPPAGGYDYFFNQGQGGTFSVSINAFPFYYDPAVLRTACALWTPVGSGTPPPFTCLMPITSSDNYRLNFFDAPQNPPLRSGDRMAFTTSLVGVRADNTAAPVPCSSSSGNAQPCRWSWASTYNNFTGVGGIKSANVFPVDLPGLGGITITNINGVQQSPPATTCVMDKTVLWPPNNKAVPIIVSGQATAGTSALVGGSYRVNDEYQDNQSSATFFLSSDGHYSFTVPLLAGRNGSDRDGRTYEIVVSVADLVGNVGVCSAMAIVPHDHR